MEPYEGMLQAVETAHGTDCGCPVVDACGYEAVDQSQHYGIFHQVIAATVF
jgi:hypothetical protein